MSWLVVQEHAQRFAELLGVRTNNRGDNTTPIEPM